MHRVQGNGWLLVAASAALLSYFLPTVAWWRESPPWLRSLVVSALVFASFTALHFRAHWVATLRFLRRRQHERRRLQGRIDDALEDAARSAWLVADNLREIDMRQIDPTRRLYLQGAEAHSRKLAEVLARLRALLEEPSDGDGEAT